MHHPFSAHDFIALPHLPAAELIALIEQLDAVGRREPSLPPPLVQSLRELVGAAEALRAARTAQSGPAQPSPEVAREADHDLDIVWSAVRDWLLGWCKLPREDNPHAAVAQALFSRLFPEGLSFLTQPFRAEWAASEARLRAIESEQLETIFEDLGGQPFLRTLRRVHAVHAAEFTQAGGRGTDANAAAATEAAAQRLKTYVAQVVAGAGTQPDTRTRAERLLAPLAAALRQGPRPPSRHAS